MMDCWQHVPQDRPTFSKILRLIADYDSNLYQNILKLPCYSNLDPDSRETNHSTVEIVSVNPTYGDNVVPTTRSTNRPSTLEKSSDSQFEPLQSPGASNGHSPPKNRNRFTTQTMVTTLSYHPDEEDYESMKRRLTMEAQQRHQRQSQTDGNTRIYENFTESELWYTLLPCQNQMQPPLLHPRYVQNWIFASRNWRCAIEFHQFPLDLSLDMI